jgi:hypothetical protein
MVRSHDWHDEESIVTSMRDFIVGIALVVLAAVAYGCVQVSCDAINAYTN